MENDRNRRLVLGILLVAIVVATVGTTLAYFITQGGTNEEQKLTIKTGNLALTFEDNDEGLNASLSLGQTVSKEFKITNTGTEDVTTTMLWSGLGNTYLEESLQYRLQYKTSETGDWQEANIAHGTIPHSETTKDYNLSKDIIIPSGETHFYKLDITFLNLANINQENDKTARLITKFNLGEKIVEGKNILSVRQSYNSAEKLWAHADNITQVVFENTISPKENAGYTYDMSDYSSEGVTAYLVPNGETITNSDNSTSPAYTAYIQADGNIMANSNSSYLFSQFKNLKNIIGLGNLDTNNVTNMKGMFYNCNKLTSLDVSQWNTSNITDMGSIFYYCSSLTNLDVSKWDTSNVTNMSYMFYRCSGLTNLNVNNFVTKKVIDMSCMFRDCSKLTELNLSNFNTSNVTKMGSMFNYCTNLTNLNLSSFDTSKTTDMGCMFQYCRSLTNLDISHFNTGKVNSMGYMFQNCSNLTSLNLGDIDISEVSRKDNIFSNVLSSIQIIVKNESIRNWCIEASNNPKLTASNFIIG